MSETLMSRDEIEEMIVAKVVEDPEFAAKLKADPKAALSTMFDTKLPPDMEVHVFQETPHSVMIRLPMVVSDEVTEEELEGVAGGACTPFLKVAAKVAVRIIAGGISGGVGGYMSAPSKKW